MNKPQLAEKHLLLTLPLAHPYKFRKDYLLMLDNLAIAYLELAKYGKALDLSFQTITFYEVDKNDEGLSISLNNIGLTYYKLKDYEKALKYYLRCLEVTHHIEGKSFLNRLLCNISLCYAFTNKFDDAKKYIDEAFKVCGSECSSYFLVEAHFSLGVINFRSNELSEAEVHFKKSYELSKE